MREVKADLVARFIDEGARLLVEEGPAGLSLRKVAAAAGVSTMPVYTLFGDKAGLLAAMHREGFRRLGAAMSEVPESEEPLDYLRALGVAYRQAALRSPNLYDLMFGHQFEPDTEGQVAAEATFTPLVDAVARCQRAGTFVQGDPRRIALHLWAVSHGMISLELNGKVAERVEELYLEALFLAAKPFVADFS